jgi:glycosyltransferase involved in cell wall biosynthesis
VLEGGDGRQKEELDRLIRFIEKQPPFDLVNITNSLLSGLAPELKKRLRCPIVCNVQGEENFLEAMGAEVLSEARKLIRQNAREIDLFVASSQAYARKMIEFLGVAPARIVPVEAGIDCEPFTRDTPRPHHPFTIGYLSAITPGKGLDILVEAVSTLVIRDKREVFLKIGGKVLDKKYWKETMALADSSGIGPRVEYIGEPDDKGKAEFLKSLSVFVQPSRVRESRGIAALEAMAAGTPLIAPASGVFPEIIENTKGGVSFFSGDSEGIGNRLLDMLDDPAFADRLGENAAKGVREIYSASGMAAKVADLYARLISGELKSTGTDIIPKDLSARDRSEPVGE